MLPPKQYLSMYQKFGLIPETEPQPQQMPYTVLTLAVYTILIPLIKDNQRECTALAVRRKQGIFSMSLGPMEYKKK
jgi:hypothetical protein